MLKCLRPKFSYHSISRVRVTSPCDPCNVHSGRKTGLDLHHSTRKKSSSSGSVSSTEVSKFSSLSSTWWDASQNPLISMNPIRMKRILQVMRSRHDNEKNRLQDPYPLLAMKALDVGCGGGLLSESLARLGASVTAIDPSKDIVEVAKKRAKFDKHILDNIDYQGGISVEDLASSTSNHGIYDMVCILEVIEHATNPQSLLQAAAQLLKRPTTEKGIQSPGGTLFISTLNRTPKSYLFAILGAEHVLRLLPVGTHDWGKFKSPREVQDMIDLVRLDPLPSDPNTTYTNLSSLKQLDVCGMTFSPDVYGKSFKWTLDSNDLDVNWIGSYGFSHHGKY